MRRFQGCTFLRNWINRLNMTETLSKDWIINKSDLILITGANGFVGSKVFERLLEYGFKRLRCLVRSSKNLSKLEKIADSSTADVEFFQGNLLSRDDCLRAAKGVTVIYHLAAGIDKTFPGCFLNSVVTTRNLLDAVINEPTLRRFVNISSFSVYSNEKIRRGGLLDESCELEANLVGRHDPYAYGKAKQDQIVIQYADKHSVPYVIVRAGVVFGPGKAKIHGRVGSDTFGAFLHLGLNNRMPFTYVDNCAEAIVLAGLRQGIDGQVFNITDDDLPTSRQFLKQYKQQVKNITSVPVPYWLWYSFNTLWEKYSNWSEGQLPPVFNRASCAIYWKGNTYSNKKAKELLGWSPKVNMADALKIFFMYMKNEQDKKKIND
jgi:nucleoside-diphosphate-sugar epimerase